MALTDRTLAIATASLVIGVTVLGLKFFAWYLTGSIALYSDALESIVRVFALSAVEHIEPLDRSQQVRRGGDQ